MVDWTLCVTVELFSDQFRLQRWESPPLPLVHLAGRSYDGFHLHTHRQRRCDEWQTLESVMQQPLQSCSDQMCQLLLVSSWVTGHWPVVRVLAFPVTLCREGRWNQLELQLHTFTPFHTILLCLISMCSNCVEIWTKTEMTLNSSEMCSIYCSITAPTLQWGISSSYLSAHVTAQTYQVPVGPQHLIGCWHFTHKLFYWSFPLKLIHCICWNVVCPEKQKDILLHIYCRLTLF